MSDFVGVREVAGIIGVRPSLLSLRIFRDRDIADACVIENGKRLIPASMVPDLLERYGQARAVGVGNEA